MQKLAMFATIFLAALSLAGCVQMYNDTTIGKDGSGTATFLMSLSPGMAEAIKEMEDLGMNEGQDMDVPEFDKINRKDLEESIKGHGVKITKFEKDTAEGSMKMDLALEFEDLKGLSYVMGKIMGGQPGDGMGIFETADGNFVLKQANYDFPADPDEEAAPAEETAKEEKTSTLTDEEKAQKQMELMGKMMGSMAELDVKFTITVPGEVIESNAPVVEGNTSTWAINAGNMMNQQDNDMDPVITFSSKGLKIKPLKE